MKVAPIRYPGANGQGCRICDLPSAQRRAVNGAIWDNDIRATRYIQAAKRTFEVQTGLTIGDGSVTRHAEHIEKSWHDATPGSPARPGEELVFATDYKSVHDKAALLGVQAMDALQGMVEKGSLDGRELVNLAKMGVTARSNQERLAAVSKRPMIEVRAIFAIASGHAEGWPEHEVIDVVPIESLREEVAAERRQLERLQAGDHASSSVSAFDSLFDP